MIDITTRLQALESIIETGRASFISVGEALCQIKAEGLYKEFGTFELYCQTRWGFGKRYANMIIGSAEVAKELEAEAGTRVPTEKQARELKKAPKEKRAKVLERATQKAASEDRPVTAADIRDQINAANPPDDAQTPSDAPADSGTGEETTSFGDKQEYDIHEFTRSLDALCEEFKSVATKAQRPKTRELLLWWANEFK